MPGPPPKAPASRQRRNKSTTAKTIVAAAAVKAELPEGWEAHELTVVWWDTIWASPIVDEWVDADVPGLVMVAKLVDDFWKTGDPKAHAEIRLALKEYGLSPLSRRSLQWEIKRLEQVDKPKPAPRRSRKASKSTLSVLEGGRSG